MEREKQKSVKWRQIENIPNYEFSEFGEIRSLPMVGNFWKGRTLKTRRDRNGYERVHLSINKKSQTFFVHRLIAMAFIPNLENKPQVNHKDGNKMNNKIENLEWATQSENQQHRYRVLGQHSVGREKASRPVICVETGVRYKSAREAERQTGVSHSAILSVVDGKLAVKNGYVYRCLTAGGFRWRSA